MDSYIVNFLSLGHSFELLALTLLQEKKKETFPNKKLKDIDNHKDKLDNSWRNRRDLFSLEPWYQLVRIFRITDCNSILGRPQ